MSGRELHANEISTDTALVRRLLANRFLRWATLPIEPVDAGGTDHAIYRLGERMCVRLPRIPSAAAQGEKEASWLPRLAPHLPLPVPVPLAAVAPSEAFPWPWTVRPWLAGEEASVAPLADPCIAALELASFVSALQRCDATSGPAPGAHNFSRGEPLSRRDDATRAAIESGRDLLADAGAVRAAWDAAMDAREWSEPPVWIHGDLSARNLLVDGGRLSAVIDFGGLGVGDPACDLAVAWSFFSGDARARFRSELGFDAATWARARGWALSNALIALPYYRLTHPVLVRESRRAIEEVLADPGVRL